MLPEWVTERLERIKSRIEARSTYPVVTQNKERLQEKRDRKYLNNFYNKKVDKSGKWKQYRDNPPPAVKKLLEEIGKWRKVVSSVPIKKRVKAIYKRAVERGCK